MVLKRVMRRTRLLSSFAPAAARTPARGRIGKVAFPRDGAGNDYGVNWAVASLGVSLGDRLAFRNPSTELLAQFAGSGHVVDGTGVGAVNWKKENKKTMFMDEANVDFDTFAEIVAAAEEAASNPMQEGHVEDAVFVVDLSIGRGRPYVNLRAVTDDPAMASQLAKLLFKSPKRSAPEFRYATELLHSQKADAEADTAYCAVFGQKAVARGPVELEKVVSALASASAKAFLNGADPALALKGSAYIDEKSGDVTLALGAHSPPKGLKPAATAHFLWGMHGISEMLNSGIAQPYPFNSNLLPHPKNILLPKGKATASKPEGKNEKVESPEDSGPTPAEILHDRVRQAGGFAMGGTCAETKLFDKLLSSSNANITST